MQMILLVTAIFLGVDTASVLNVSTPTLPADKSIQWSIIDSVFFSAGLLLQGVSMCFLIWIVMICRSWRKAADMVRSHPYRGAEHTEDTTYAEYVEHIVHTTYAEHAARNVHVCVELQFIGSSMVPATRTKEKECPICLGELHNKVTMTCFHTFCKKCIVTWMTAHDTCPICRVDPRPKIETVV